MERAEQIRDVPHAISGMSLPELAAEAFTEPRMRKPIYRRVNRERGLLQKTLDIDAASSFILKVRR